MTTEGLGSGNVCAPDTTWTLVRRTSQANGQVVQTTFWAPSGTAASYPFTFSTNGCPATAANATAVPASGVLVRYSGVDPVNPIDPIDLNQIVDNSGNGATMSAGAVTTQAGNERIVWVYGTGSTSVGLIYWYPDGERFDCRPNHRHRRGR